MAGVDVRFAVEFDKHAASTYRTNHTNTKLFEDDIAKLPEIPVKKPRRCQTVLFGGPPCQGFSTSNRRTRSVQNKHNWLFHEFLRLASSWEPDWIVFENVKGITEKVGGHVTDELEQVVGQKLQNSDERFIDRVLEQIEKIGYTPSYAVLNAVHFGVPQRRMRLFVIASRNGKTIQFPLQQTRQLAVAEALSDLPSLTNGASVDTLPYRDDTEPSEYAKVLRAHTEKSSGHLVTRNASYVVERYRHIPQGGNFKDIPKELMSNYKKVDNCHTGIYHRLDPNKASVVIGNYRKNMLIHPFEDRGLSVREAARIQSFPDYYEFCGSIGFRQQQVGNAVPPILAQVVFNSLFNNECFHN